MTVKTKSQRFKRLISHGYFAPELPPCFVSEDLARYCKTFWRDIEAVAGESIDQLVTQTSWFNFPRTAYCFESAATTC